MSEFILPAWLSRFVSKRTKADMERRASLTGTARQTRSYWFGLIEIEVKTTDLYHASYVSPKVFDGTRELSPERAERLRRDYQRTHGIDATFVKAPACAAVDVSERAKNCTYGNPDCPQCNPEWEWVEREGGK